VKLHEDVLGGWRYRSTHYKPRQQTEGSGQLHAPAALPPGKSRKYPLDRMLCGPQNRSGRGDEKNIPATPGNRIPVVQHTHTGTRACYCVNQIEISFVLENQKINTFRNKSPATGLRLEPVQSSTHFRTIFLEDAL
jgi:hypothetical protein